MRTKSKLHYFVAILAVAGLLLSGCALSPQQIQLMPRVTTSQLPFGNDRAVYVEVLDARQNRQLGSRGGIYRDTSDIHLAANLTDSLTTSVESVLKQLGFSVMDAEDAVKFTLIISDVVYSSPNKVYANEFDTLVNLQLRVEDQNHLFESSFKTTSNDKFLTVPNEATNTVILNKVFTQTLERMFADPKLQRFFE